MNIALVFSDAPRYWTVGSYIKRILAEQDHINVVAHPRIPEDVPIIEESCGLDIDLVLVIDCSVHYKLHHSLGKLSPKTKTAFWISDMHRQDWAQWRLQMINEWHYDHVFYAQKNFKKMIIDTKKYNVSEISWLPHAVDPQIFKPLQQITKRYDMGLVGYMNEKRKKAVDIMSEYMNVKHFNSVWELTANRCINECKIGFNISVEDDINMRLFETMASGVPLLTNKIENNGMEDLFGNDEKYFLTYSSDKEMKEKAVRLIANPDIRNTLSNNARQHILQYHTYRNRLNTILATFNMELLKNNE